MIVKKVCQQLGISKKELAVLIGCNYGTLINWGNKNPPLWAKKTCLLLLRVNKLRKLNVALIEELQREKKEHYEK